jgi:hypothetical protein
MPAVGKIESVLANGKNSGCSGTVVTRTLLLTAAHCVYDHRSGFHTRILFTPGMTAGGLGSYGVWEARRWWAPRGYLAGDDSQDYALVEFGPQAGRYIGDVTGTWTIHFGQPWPRGRRVYAAGYPASGFWNTAAGFLGRGQYACDTTYDRYASLGSGYELWLPCTMNRGSSGGPWFGQLANGQWTIVGVNSKCWGPNMHDPDRYCDPYSYNLRSPYLDSRFLAFWQSIH